MTTPLSLSIGALAAQAGVNVETIRFYPRRGLLPQPARPPRGMRTYDPEVVHRIRFIKAAQAWGFSLADVAELLLLEDGTACSRARQIAADRLAVVRVRLQELRRIEDALRSAVSACNTGRQRMSCPLIASLRVPPMRPSTRATRPRAFAAGRRSPAGSRP